jgi:hypothetical protein
MKNKESVGVTLWIVRVDDITSTLRLEFSGDGSYGGIELQNDGRTRIMKEVENIGRLTWDRFNLGEI